MKSFKFLTNNILPSSIICIEMYDVNTGVSFGIPSHVYNYIYKQVEDYYYGFDQRSFILYCSYIFEIKNVYHTVNNTLIGELKLKKFGEQEYKDIRITIQNILHYARV